MLLILDDSFSGQYSPYLIKRAMFQMDTLQKGLVWLKSDITKIYHIDRMDLQNPLSVYQDTPVDSGLNPITIDGRTLIPQPVQAVKYVNPQDLTTSQLGLLLAQAIQSRIIPNEIAAQIFSLILSRAGEKFELMAWQGSVAYRGRYTEADDLYQLQFFDGYITKCVSDPLVKKVAGAVALTASNTTQALDALMDLILGVNHGALLSDKDSFEDMKFMMGPKAYLYYLTQLGAGYDFKGATLAQAIPDRWKGYRIERCSGMPDNTIMFARASDNMEKSNLWMGCNSEKDWELRIDRIQPLSDTYGIVGKWKWDVNYGYSDEIAIYTTLTPASFIPAELGE